MLATMEISCVMRLPRKQAQYMGRYINLHILLGSEYQTVRETANPWLARY